MSLNWDINNGENLKEKKLNNFEIGTLQFEKDHIDGGENCNSLLSFSFNI